MTTSNNAAKTNVQPYADLITTGIGYIGRIRVVTPNQGDAYIATTISALRGQLGTKKYTKIDCIVKGADAIALFSDAELVARMDEKDAKVFTRFSIGDIEANSFISSNEDTKGQTVNICKGRLLKLHFIEINGERVEHDLLKAKVGAVNDQDLPEASLDAKTPAPLEIVELEMASPTFANDMGVLMAKGFTLDRKSVV